MNEHEQMECFRSALLRWNQTINLIGPEARDHLDDHIAEAIEAARILRPAGEVLDFGSGGGLPAIPMAIAAPQARFHLVEADRRKWAFLKHVARECRLNALVYGDRLESVLKQLPPDLRFQLIVSRAVGSPDRWIPHLRNHIARGGRIGLFQGTPEAPVVAGFSGCETHRLPRGQSNYLAVLSFHVEQ